MKKTLYTFGMALWMGVLLFSACMNPLGEKPETREAQENRGLVEIQVGSGARTLQPDQDGFIRYTFTFAGPEGAAHGEEALTGGTSKTVELSPGKWTITASAYSGTPDAPVMAAKGEAGVEVAAGGAVTAAITLSPYTGSDAAAGTLKYTVSYPADLKSAELSIVQGDTPVGSPVGLLDPGNRKEGSLSLGAGAYRLQIRLTDKADVAAGFTEALHIYPGLESKIERTFDNEDFVAFGEVGDVTVSGTAPYDDPGTAVEVEVRITLYNESFKEDILDSEAEDKAKVKAWFTNLPEGLEVVPKSSVVAGAREITLSITGMPANKEAAGSKELVISIPGADLQSGKDLALRSNPEAKFAIGLPDASATVEDVILAGETNKPFTGAVRITLKNARFKAIAGDASLNGWFTDLPAGLSALPSATVAAGTKGIMVNISGTVATAVGSAPLGISIPGDVLDRAQDLTVTPNPGATLSITEPPKAVYIAGQVDPSSTATYAPQYHYVWKYSTTGTPLSVFKSEDASVAVTVTDMAVDSAGAVHLVGSRYTTAATFLYQKNNEDIISTWKTNNLPKIGLAPDDSLYIAAYDRSSTTQAEQVWKFWKVEEGTPDPAQKLTLGRSNSTPGLNSVTGIVVDEEYIYIGVFSNPNPGFFRVKRSDDFTAADYQVEFHKLDSLDMTPYAIALSGDYLHIAGSTPAGVSSSGYASYVKVHKSSGALEGTMIREPDRSQALGIAVSGSGEVYLTGTWHEPVSTQFRHGAAVYWKVTGNALDRHSITTISTAVTSNPSVYDRGSSIALDGDDLYIAGYKGKVFNNGVASQPVYWKVPANGTPVETILYENVTDKYAGLAATQAVVIVVR